MTWLALTGCTAANPAFDAGGTGDGTADATTKDKPSTTDSISDSLTDASTLSGASTDPTSATGPGPDDSSASHDGPGTSGNPDDGTSGPSSLTDPVTSSTTEPSDTMANDTGGSTDSAGMMCELEGGSCATCIIDSCCEQLATCQLAGPCACFAQCIALGGDSGGCLEDCALKALPDGWQLLGACINMHCDNANACPSLGG